MVVGSFPTGLGGTSACAILEHGGETLLAISDYGRTSRTYVVRPEQALADGGLSNAVVFSYENEGFSQGLVWDGVSLLEAENKKGVDVINQMDVEQARRDRERAQVHGPPARRAGPGRRGPRVRRPAPLHVRRGGLSLLPLRVGPERNPSRMIAHAVTLSRLGIAAAFVVCLARAVQDGGLTTGWTVLLIAIAVLEEATDIVDGVIARRLGTAGPRRRHPGSAVRFAEPPGDVLRLALCGLVTIAVPLVMTGRDIVVSYVRIFSALTGGRTSARVSGKLKAIVQGSGAPLLVLVAWQRPHLSPEAADRWTTWIAVAVIAVTVWSLSTT